MIRTIVALLGGFALLLVSGCATSYQAQIITRRLDQTDETVKQIAQTQVAQGQQIGTLIGAVTQLSQTAQAGIESNNQKLQELAAVMPTRTLATGKVGIVKPAPSMAVVRKTVTIMPGDQSGPKFTVDQVRRGEVDLSTLTGVMVNNYLPGRVLPITRSVNQKDYAFTDEGNLIQFWLDDKAVLPAGTTAPTELIITWK